MQLGMIGLGRMGANMAERVRRGGHTIVGYDVSADSGRDVATLEELVAALTPPRAVWIMVPLQFVGPTVETLAGLLGEGDVVVDGGNSRWSDDKERAGLLAERGVGFVDCGVSGGIWGLDNGYALMCGGSADDVARLRPVFDALRPEGGSGFVHAGPVGAGHFTKMVHNGIEYGMMQALAEGYELLTAAELVEDPDACVRSWRKGTVIQSWLLDLLARSFDDDPRLEQIDDYAEDSGEGRWTVEAAVDNAVPISTISAALFARFASRQHESVAMKAVAAMRNQFGGHAIHRADGTVSEPVRRPDGTTVPPRSRD
ncbi:MAG: decarboxylating 6-phosphogluconate dehydrogenase [Streptosporangiales bacterium]|nr:decarboxylating 6-phosphogluconate dehydrogenase [Streptosporangiales bacterium]